MPCGSEHMHIACLWVPSTQRVIVEWTGLTVASCLQSRWPASPHTMQRT